MDVTPTQVLLQLDFATASLQEIEALFQSFSTMEYDIHEGVRNVLLSTTPVDPFNYSPTHICAESAIINHALQISLICSIGDSIWWLPILSE